MPSHNAQPLSRFHANIGRKPNSRGRGPKADHIMRAYREVQMLIRVSQSFIINPDKLNQLRSRIRHLSELDGFPISVEFNSMTQHATLHKVLPCVVHKIDSPRVQNAEWVPYIRRRIDNFDRYGFRVMRAAFHWPDHEQAPDQDGNQPRIQRPRIDLLHPDRIIQPNDEFHDFSHVDFRDPDPNVVKPYHVGDIACLGPFHLDKHGPELINHFEAVKFKYEKRNFAKINHYITLVDSDEGPKVAMNADDYDRMVDSITAGYTNTSNASEIDAWKAQDVEDAFTKLDKQMRITDEPDYDPKRFFILMHKIEDIRYNPDYGDDIEQPNDNELRAMKSERSITL